MTTAKLLAVLMFAGCASSQGMDPHLVTDLASALERVSENFGVRIGLEYRTSQATPASVRFPLDARTARAALSGIVNQMPGYTWRFSAGVAHVYAPRIAQDKRNWLNVTVHEDFSKIPPLTTRAASAILMQGVEEIVTAHKGGGRGGSFAAGAEEPSFTLKMQTGTVREYLNELVRMSRARMWVVEFSDSSIMTDEGFFQVASVASGASRSLWRLLSMRPVSGPVIVKYPIVLSWRQPTYTEEARRLRNQGCVVILVEVDPTGRPKATRVLQSLGNGLDERAIEAVQKWRFRPAYEAGKPVAMYTTVEAEFHLP